MELRVEDLVVKYQNVVAVDHLSCTFASGGLIGIVGPNGAGKSTLIKVLATLLKPSGGKLFLDGQDIIQKPSYMRSRIGYLPQEPAVYKNLSAQEFLSYMASMKGLAKKTADKQIPELLDLLHIAECKDQKISGFSGGMRQRVGIACALLAYPQVIIVDEPTSGLDPQERVSLRNLLSSLAKERIVLLSTHIISDVEAVATDIVVLKKGKILFDGAPSALIANATGCVWEYMAPIGTDMSDIKGIGSMVQCEDGVHVRRACGQKPCPDAVPTDPTLEDACLYVLEVLGQ